MTPIDNYNNQVTQSGPAMTQDYYNNQPPFKGAPAAIPFVPIDASGNPLVSTAECPYKYAELQMPDGTSYLAVITPWTVGGGPGEKYRVEV